MTKEREKEIREGCDDRDLAITDLLAEIDQLRSQLTVAVELLTEFEPYMGKEAVKSFSKIRGEK